MLDFIFSILVLLFSVIIHEVSHGYAAYVQGDNTAKFRGRLSLNPLVHLEWFGSFFLPIISYFLGGFIIGWAKPVPFNPYNLRNQRWGEAIVAIAGPLANIIIATIFGLLLRTGLAVSMGGEAFVSISVMIVTINLVLATFNLVPIPPLDGSRILFSILPYHFQSIRDFLERNGTMFLMIFIFFLWQYFLPLVGLEFKLLTGLTAL